MGNRQVKLYSLLLVITLVLSMVSKSQNFLEKKHIEVSLRMIGHQVLLDLDDSISRVLPIIEDSGRYKIQFESEFIFDGDKLVSTIIDVVEETKLANNYIVEVEECDSNNVVFAFEIGNSKQHNIIPCRTRVQSKSCYSLLFTLLEDKSIGKNESSIEVITENENQESTSIWYVIGFFFILIPILISVWKKRVKTTTNPNLIKIGSYFFDKKNTELLIEDQKIELTSKEADLLLLLFKDVNNTIERDVILNVVWGDEGDYIGRTLDVFISKLRKKLDSDPNIKIVNIRGVGYKLVLDL